MTTDTSTDLDDMRARLRRVLPRGWFPDTAPVLDAVLDGFGSGLVFFRELFAAVQPQTRIKTATGGMLDLMAGDFLGDDFRRGDNETDAGFRARLLVQIFRARATRKALHDILLELTGREPLIVEPANIGDCGALGATLALGQHGCLGSLNMPCQAFVTVYRPASIGVPNVAGLACPQGGLGSSFWLVADGALLSLPDQSLFDAVNAVRPVGTTIWVQLST